MLELIKGFIKVVLEGYGGQEGFSLKAGISVIGLRGTELTVTYDPEHDRVEVEVHEGEVVLTGPGGSKLIKAGQRAIMINGNFQTEPHA